MNNLQTNKEQQKQNTLTAEQLQRSQELMRLQTWDGLAPNETKTQHLTNIALFQTAYDKSVIENMQRLGNKVDVTGSAHVAQPPVPAPAAEETRKERRQRVKDEKQAAADLQELSKTRAEALTPELSEQATEKGYDLRAIQCYCDGYKKNWFGNPASEKDRETQARNAVFVQHYINGTPQEHDACLQEMKNKFLACKFDLHMLDDQKNVLRHLTEYKQMGDRATYFENVIKDNQAWYNALPAAEQDKIQEQLSYYAMFSATLGAIGAACHVEMNRAIYLGNDPNLLRMAEANAAMAPEMLKNYKDIWLENTVKREAKGFAAEDHDDYMRQDVLFQREYGVSFPNGATELQYSDLAKYREMIATNPETYEANRELIDAMYSDLYRTYERIGQKSLEMKAVQSVMDTHNSPAEFSGTDDDLITQKASAKSEEMVKDNAAYLHYANGLMDAIKHLLKGSAPTEETPLILERYRAQMAPQQPDQGQQ